MMLVFRTAFDPSELELYQHAIIGFGGEIRTNGRYSFELYLPNRETARFWRRFREMRRLKDVGDEYWMLPNEREYPIGWGD